MVNGKTTSIDRLTKGCPSYKRWADIVISWAEHCTRQAFARAQYTKRERFNRASIYAYIKHDQHIIIYMTAPNLLVYCIHRQYPGYLLESQLVITRTVAVHGLMSLENKSTAGKTSNKKGRFYTTQEA